MFRLPKKLHLRLPLFTRVVAVYGVIGVLALYSAPIVHAAVPIKQPVARMATHTALPTVTFESTTRVTGQPTILRIPRLGVALSVIDGAYNQASDSWTLTDDKAQFASMTSLPNNENGNTFIYGHNTNAVFAPLAWLRPGDEAIIETSNGKQFTYTYSGNQIVNPTTISILEPTEAPRLTLMTCEGIFSEARRVALFDFQKVL